MSLARESKTVSKINFKMVVTGGSEDWVRTHQMSRDTDTLFLPVLFE